MKTILMLVNAKWLTVWYEWLEDIFMWILSNSNNQEQLLKHIEPSRYSEKYTQ